MADKTRILVVVADDDADDQELIKKGLAGFRLEVEMNSVYNGLQLLDYLLKRDAYKNIPGSPDLILLDLNMPLMDGFSVLKEIRNHDSLKKIPLYVISTSHSVRDREKALSLGATGFYPKGWGPDDIRDIMEAICQQSFPQAT